MSQQQRLRERLTAHVDKRDEPDGCWNWHGQIANNGQGRIKIRDSYGDLYMESAPRASYMAFVAEIPAGHDVIQTCGNRLCINPAHLQLFDPCNRLRVVK